MAQLRTRILGLLNTLAIFLLAMFLVNTTPLITSQSLLFPPGIFLNFTYSQMSISSSLRTSGVTYRMNKECTTLMSTMVIKRLGTKTPLSSSVHFYKRSKLTEFWHVAFISVEKQCSGYFHNAREKEFVSL